MYIICRFKVFYTFYPRNIIISISHILKSIVISIYNQLNSIEISIQKIRPTSPSGSADRIPYIPLINFQQLVDLGEELPEGIQGVVVLIDEISSVLSHRNYASFPLELVSMLCQQRKRHIYIMCTAQRFFMVDKIWRSITTNVFDCEKFWRFQHVAKYDAWEYENAMNTQLIRRVGHRWWFVRDKDYNSQNVFQCYQDRCNLGNNVPFSSESRTATSCFSYLE